MEAGISTACFYPEYVENAVLFLAENGARNIEIFINSDCELKKDFICDIKKKIDDFGIKVASLHPFTCGIEPMMFFTPYERRFYDILDYYKKYFNAMNILGGKIFVFHGNKPQNYFEDERYFERFAKLFETGREFGITVAQENVERCVSGKLSFLKKMADYLGDAANFVLDVKQTVRSGENVFDYLNELGSKIIHVHYSENGRRGDCLPFGTGDFDRSAFLKKLKELNFHGSVILELYRENYSDYDFLIKNYFELQEAVKTSALKQH